MSDCTRKIEVDPKFGIPVVGRWYLSEAGGTSRHLVTAIRRRAGDLNPYVVLTDQWSEDEESGRWKSDGPWPTYPGERTTSGTPFVDFTKPCDPPPGYEAIEYVPRKSDAEYLASKIPGARSYHQSFVASQGTCIGVSDIPNVAQAFRDAEKWREHCVSTSKTP